jgi:hypothetical protein
MQLSGLFFVIGLVITAILLIPLLIGGVFVIVVVANRADPDPSGRRPAVVYAFATAFVTVFVTLFATAALVASLCDLIGSHHRRGGGGGIFGGLGATHLSQHPVGDAVARGSVLSALVAIVAGCVYLLHARAAGRMTDGAPPAEPVARVRASYVSAVSFVCVFIIVVATVVVAYDIFRVIAPGVFAPATGGDRAVVVRGMIPTFYLAVAAGALLLMHLRHAPPPLRPRYAERMPAGPLGGGAVAPPPATPAAPAPATSVVTPPVSTAAPSVPEVASPPPRKRAPRKTTGA